MNRKLVLFGCGGLVAVCIVVGIVAGRGAQSNTVARTSTGQAPAPTESKTGQTATSQGSTGQASNPKSAPEPTAQPKVGDSVSSGNWEYKVTQVKRSQDPLVWSSFGNSSVATGEWLIIDLSLKNIGRQNFGINIIDFEVLDNKGIKYQHSTDIAALGAFQEYQKLSKLGSQVPPGVPINTALVFDIAPDAQGLVLDLKQARTKVSLE